MADIASTDRTRHEFLDALRGYAIGGVVLVHASQSIDGLPGWLDNLAGFGAMGVPLFFVVSGLTLAMNYGHGGSNWSEFYKRRFFRLAPMFYLAAGVYAIIGATTAMEYAPRTTNLVQWITTLTFTHGWHPVTINGIVPGGWSIAAEAMFYLLFPLLIPTATSLWRTVLMLGTSILLALAAFVLIPQLVGSGDYKVDTFNYYFWLTNLPAFAMGIAIYAARTLGNPLVDRLLSLLGRPWMLWVLLAAILTSAVSAATTFITTHILLALFTASVAQTPARYIVTHAAAFLGKISYSVYFVHFAVVAACGGVAEQLTRAIGPSAALAVFFPMCLAIASALSFVTYRWIEKPGIRLGKQIGWPTPAPANRS